MLLIKIEGETERPFYIMSEEHKMTKLSMKSSMKSFKKGIYSVIN